MMLVCRFNTRDADGTVVDQNRASCIMPPFTEAEVVIVIVIIIIVFFVIVFVASIILVYVVTIIQS